MPDDPLYDSVSADNIPTSIPPNAGVAGYGDGRFKWSAADWARFKGHLELRIVVSASDDGDVLDVENGDATPAEAPGWAQRQRERGADPIVYCNESTWPAVAAAFEDDSVQLPTFWIADYNGVATIKPGAGGMQYEGNVTPGPGWGNVDVSVDDGTGPFAPPGAPPPPTTTESADMSTLNTSRPVWIGGRWVYYSVTGGCLLEQTAPVGNPPTLDVFKDAGLNVGNLVDQTPQVGVSSDGTQLAVTVQGGATGRLCAFIKIGDAHYSTSQP